MWTGAFLGTAAPLVFGFDDFDGFDGFDFDGFDGFDGFDFDGFDFVFAFGFALGLDFDPCDGEVFDDFIGDPHEDTCTACPHHESWDGCERRYSPSTSIHVANIERPDSRTPRNAR